MNKIHPDYIKIMGLPNDSMPTIGQIVESIKKIEKSLKRHKNKHNKKYGKLLKENPYKSPMNIPLPNKTPKYVLDYKTSNLKAEYLTDVVSDLKTLIAMIEADEAYNNPINQKRNESVTTTQEMISHPSSVEQFLYLAATRANKEEAKSLLDDFNKSTSEEKEQLDDYFNEAPVGK